MQEAQERRKPTEPRIPLDDTLVELSLDGFQTAPFKADGINVGSGGLSMRAAVLPEVGADMRCRFRTPQGDIVTAICEVAWAQDSGPFLGEVGLRFVRIDEASNQSLESMLQTWLSGFSTVDDEPAANPLTEVHLEGIAAPIVAEVVKQEDAEWLLEQPLPFLEIGTGVRVEGSDMSGVLRDVSLYLENATPRLRMRIDLGKADSPTCADVSSPAASASAQQTATAQPTARVDSDQLDTPNDHDLAVHALGHEDVSGERALPSMQREERLPATTRVNRTEALNHWRERISKALALTKNKLILAFGALGTLVLTGWRRVNSFITGFKSNRQQRTQRAGSGNTRTQRRTSEPAQRPTKQAHSLTRIVMSGALIAVLFGGLIWALFSKDDVPQPPEAAAAPEVEPEAVAAPSTLGASPTTARVTQTPPTPEVAAAPTLPRLNPKAFGNGVVTDGQTFELNMSRRVKNVEGQKFADGFRVVIPGALSLSKAGPIAESHPAVSQAMIFNRGDHAELSIRFVPGLAPAYHIEGDGQKLILKIAE